MIPFPFADVVIELVDADCIDPEGPALESLSQVHQRFDTGGGDAKGI